MCYLDAWPGLNMLPIWNLSMTKPRPTPTMPYTPTFTRFTPPSGCFACGAHRGKDR